MMLLICNRIETDGRSSVGLVVPWVIKLNEMLLQSSAYLICYTEVSFFNTVTADVDGFVPCWHEALCNPDSATSSDVLNSAAVQLQCGRYVSKCDLSVFQSHSSHLTCLHIRADSHDRKCPFRSLSNSAPSYNVSPSVYITIVRLYQLAAN